MHFLSEQQEGSSQVDLDGILKLAAECSVYFNDHKSTLEALALKLTHLIDAILGTNLLPTKIMFGRYHSFHQHGMGF